MNETLNSTTKAIEQCPDELSEAGVAPVCTGCSGQRLCKESFNMIDPDIEDIKIRMNVIKHKLLIMSGKGGVGKSTVTSSLAVSLASKGFKVGIVDLDLCGPSINNMMKIKDENIVMTTWGWKPCESPKYKIKVISVASLIGSKENAIIYKGPRKTNLIKRILKETFWGKLDYLLFDTPPGTSDEHLTIVKFLKSLNLGGGLLVTTPQKLAVNTIRKEITFARKMKLNLIGIVENMSYYTCPCCNEKSFLFPNSGSKEVALTNNVEYLGQLPFNQDLCSHIDDIESTAETELIPFFNDLTEKIISILD